MRKRRRKQIWGPWVTPQKLGDFDLLSAVLSAGAPKAELCKRTFSGYCWLTGGTMPLSRRCRCTMRKTSTLAVGLTDPLRTGLCSRKTKARGNGAARGRCIVPSRLPSPTGWAKLCRADGAQENLCVVFPVLADWAELFRAYRAWELDAAANVLSHTARRVSFFERRRRARN